MDCLKQKGELADLEVQGNNIEITKSTANRVLKQSDLYMVLPFKETKTKQLIKSGQLPLVKVGRDYITTYNILEEWIRNHVGEEIYY